MARKSVMIPFDPTSFRDIVKGHGKSLSDLEPVIGVSKQALNGWLSSSRIPPRQLHTIAQTLKWNPNEVAKVLKKSGAQGIRFRSHRNTLASEGAEETARRISTDFFTLDALDGEYNRESFVLRVGKDTSPSAVAEGILRQLNLKRGQFGLEELLQALSRANVSVIFLDFGAHFSLDSKVERSLKAFCARQGSKYLIAIDSRMKNEDVVWVIFHELAHIAYGDIDEGADEFLGDRKSEEKARNEVASEILTPTDLLLRSKAELEKFLDCDLRLLPSRVEHIANELGASFVGVVLALKKIGILSTQMQSYLWGVHNKRDKFRSSVRDLIAVPEAQSEEDLIRNWDKLLNTEDLQKFLKLHLLVRHGLIEDRISVARAAELICVEFGEMEELAKHWAAEVSDEVAD